MKRKALIPALLLLLCLLLLLSCSASVSSDSPKEFLKAYAADEEIFGSARTKMQYTSNNSNSKSAEQKAPNAAGKTQSTAENDLGSRKIIKTLDLMVETKEFDQYLSEIHQNIEDSGGYIESSSVSGRRYSSDSYRDANLAVRIPSDRLDSFRNSLSSLGNIIREEESIEDVTLKYIDVESRISSLRTEYDALLSLLEQPGSLTEVFSIQSRLTEVRASIESYESQKRKYDDLVSYSTVNLWIEEVERVSAPVAETMWEQIGNRFSDNLYTIGRGAKNFFIWLVGASPYLILLALFGLIAYFIVRALIKKNTPAGKGKDEEKLPEDKNGR